MSNNWGINTSTLTDGTFVILQANVTQATKVVNGQIVESRHLEKGTGGQVVGRAENGKYFVSFPGIIIEIDREFIKEETDE